MRETQGSVRGGVGVETGSMPRCNGSLWKTCWKEAAHSEAQGRRPVQKLLFVTSGPALRGPKSDLSNRGAGGGLQWGLWAQFLGAEPGGAPAQVSPISGAALAQKNPVLWEGRVKYSLCAVITEQLSDSHVGSAGIR